MEKEDQFLNLTGKELSGNITDNEKQELAVLLQQDALFAQQYLQIKQNWLAAETLGENFNPDAHKAWQIVKGKILPAQEIAKPVAVVKPLYGFIKYAAAIVIFGMALFFAYRVLHEPTITVATLKGERRKITLPDHSTVWLNELSKVEYAQNFNDQDKRMISLQGEAFFEVTKNPDKRFVVEAQGTKTQVYGTKFNVKANQADGLQVALLEGKVSFSDLKDTWTEMLKPGDLAYFDSKAMHGKKTFNDTNFMFWKNHELQFNDQKLQDVLSIIGKNYHVQFEIQDGPLAQKRITTTLKGDSVQQVIQVLQVLLDVQVVKKQNAYVVQSSN